MRTRTLIVLLALLVPLLAAGCKKKGGSGNIKGSLSYEARFPKVTGGYLQLGGLQTLPAVGMLALAVDGDGTLIGYQQLDGDGKYDIDPEVDLSGDETILFTTMWMPDVEGDRVDLAIAMGPGYTADPGSFQSYPWTWNADVPKDGDVGDLTVTEEQGSGALYLFLFTAAAMETVLYDLCGGNESCLQPLAVLWYPGAGWSCGACYSRQTGQWVGESNPLAFGQSIFVGGEYDGSSAWGFTVILHEFGHYVAANYSRDDSPGGPHGFGQLIAPPFAWSEGWASFYSVSTFSRWIGEPFAMYWDIQGGQSLWIDYDGATYFGGDLIRPDPYYGMDQDLDESYVASMLWHLWDGKDVPEGAGGDDGMALGTGAVLTAVGSERFTQWNRGAQGADFVDFVDAAICGGANLDAMNQTVVNVLGFPYDGQPGCP